MSALDDIGFDETRYAQSAFYRTVVGLSQVKRNYFPYLRRESVLGKYDPLAGVLPDYELHKLRGLFAFMLTCLE